MGRWEEGKPGASLSIFPLPIVPLMLSFSPHPSLSRTQRGLCGGERNTCKDYNDTRRPKKQLVKEKTTKTGALSCRARQIDSYYFITATRQAREKMLNWLLPKYHLGTVYMELGGGTPDR